MKFNDTTFRVSDSIDTDQFDRTPGFENLSHTKISVDDATLSFTIEPADGVDGFVYYEFNGNRFTKTTPQTVVVPDLVANNFFYFEDGVVKVNHDPTYEEIEEIFRTKVCIAQSYWDGDQFCGLNDIRFTRKMDTSTRANLFWNTETQIIDGLAIIDDPSDGGNIVPDPPGGNNARFGVSAGELVFLDHDFDVETLNKDESIILYWQDEANDWTCEQTNGYFFQFDINNNILYNNLVTYTQDPVPAGEFVNYFLCVLNDADISERIIGVMGRDSYSTMEEAEAAQATEISAIVDFFPYKKQNRVVYATIYESTADGTGTPEARVRQIYLATGKTDTVPQNSIPGKLVDGDDASELHNHDSLYINKSSTSVYVPLIATHPANKGYVDNKVNNASMEWKSSKTYQKGNIVCKDGNWYRSIRKDNKDKDPTSTPKGDENWIRISYHSQYETDSFDEFAKACVDTRSVCKQILATEELYGDASLAPNFTQDTVVHVKCLDNLNLATDLSFTASAGVTADILFEGATVITGSSPNISAGSGISIFFEKIILDTDGDLSLSGSGNVVYENYQYVGDTLGSIVGGEQLYWKTSTPINDTPGEEKESETWSSARAKEYADGKLDQVDNVGIGAGRVRRDITTDEDSNQIVNLKSIRAGTNITIANHISEIVINSTADSSAIQGPDSSRKNNVAVWANDKGTELKDGGEMPEAPPSPDEGGPDGWELIDNFASQTLENKTLDGAAITGGAIAGATLSGTTLLTGTITGGIIEELEAPLALSDGGTGARTQVDARTALGLGTLAQQNFNNVVITGGSADLTIPLAASSGGTGAANTQDGFDNLAPSDNTGDMIYQGKLGNTKLSSTDKEGKVLALGAPTTEDLVEHDPEPKWVKGVAEWDETVVYNLYDTVRLNGVIYSSVEDDNINHNPETAPSLWFKISIDQIYEVRDWEDFKLAMQDPDFAYKIIFITGDVAPDGIYEDTISVEIPSHDEDTIITIYGEFMGISQDKTSFTYSGTNKCEIRFPQEMVFGEPYNVVGLPGYLELNGNITMYLRRVTPKYNHYENEGLTVTCVNGAKFYYEYVDETQSPLQGDAIRKFWDSTTPIDDTAVDTKHVWSASKIKSEIASGGLDGIYEVHNWDDFVAAFEDDSRNTKEIHILDLIEMPDADVTITIPVNGKTFYYYIYALRAIKCHNGRTLSFAYSGGSTADSHIKGNDYFSLVTATSGASFTMDFSALPDSTRIYFSTLRLQQNNATFTFNKSANQDGVYYEKLILHSGVTHSGLERNFWLSTTPIDDSASSIDDIWSSSKINNEIKSAIDRIFSVVDKYNFNGLITSTDFTGDQEHDIRFGTGNCNLFKRGDLYSSDLINRKNQSIMVKKLDAVWAEGNNAGGRASSVNLTVDTWYHMFALGGVSKPSLDFGFDTDPDAGHLSSDTSASGYSYIRRIGSIYYESGSTNKIRRYSQFGREFAWDDAEIQDITSSLNDSSFTDLNILTPSLGSSIDVQAKIGLDLVQDGSTKTSIQSTSSGAYTNYLCSAKTSASTFYGYINTKSGDSNTIALGLAPGSAQPTSLMLYTYGWIDRSDDLTYYRLVK